MAQTKKPKLVVSIDFDYFIEEDPMLDMGHRESALFLQTMWDIRRHQWLDQVEQRMPFRGNIEDLAYKFLLGMKAGAHIYSAESHAMLPKALDMAEIEKCEIINFDAHHDIAYGQCPEKLATKYDCGSWGGHLLVNGRCIKYTQVYPEWRRKFPEYHDDIAEVFAPYGPVELLYADELKPDTRKIDMIFICRSGCWVPPCYDKQFNALCKIFGGKGLNERSWVLDNEALERERQMQEQFKKTGKLSYGT